MVFLVLFWEFILRSRIFADFKFWHAIYASVIKKVPRCDTGEGILRIPFRKRWQRPLYARWEQKIRLRKTSVGEDESRDLKEGQKQEEKNS